MSHAAEGPHAQARGDELDLGFVVEVLRRRWGLILAILTVAIAAGVGFSMNRQDTYTSEALIRKLESTSPLVSTSAEQRPGPPLDEMASEVELLQSRSVLEPVVGQLALRLRLPEHSHLRSRILGGVFAETEGASGEYLIRPHAQGAELTTADGAVVAVVDSSGLLEGPGFTIADGDWTALDGPVPLTVVGLADALEDVLAHLTISQTENTSLIRIRYTAEDPVFAAAVVNAMANSYLDRAVAGAREAASRRREFLGSQLASVADSVRGAQSALSDFQRESRVLDPESEAENLGSSLREEEIQIRELRYRQNLLSSLSAGLSDGSGEGLERIVTLSEEMVPGARAVYTRLRDLQDERRRLTADRYGYQEGSSRVGVLDSLIAGTTSELRSLVDESLDLAGTRLAESQQQAGQIRAQVGQLPVQATAMNRLEQRAEGMLATFDLISARFYEAQVAEAVASANVEIVDYGSPPAGPDPSSSVLPVLLAAVLGLALGGSIAVTFEGMDKTVRRVGDAEGATGLPILGMVPDLGNGADAGGKAAPLVVRWGQHGGPAAEAFKALPSIIRYARSGSTRTVAITSQGPREGKSFTAANLALAMAKGGSRTLLIDCDLHRPQVARIFEVAREPGLAEYLTGQAPYRQCLRSLPGNELTLMPAGGRSTDPAQLLSSSAFEKLLTEVASEFDAIILDTPPVLAVSEVLEIAQLVDGMVLVVRTEQTNRFALREAAARLRRVEAPLLGMVLNGVDSRSGDRGFGGYYYQFYAYSYQGDDKDEDRRIRRLEEAQTHPE